MLNYDVEQVARFPVGDPRHGLIYGPAEHDTCSMGMGSAAKVVDDQYMLYYFSVSMQSWHGMVELANLMNDFPLSAWGANATLAAELLTEAEAFKADIDVAVQNSVPPPSHNYADRNSEMTEIFLRVLRPILILM